MIISWFTENYPPNTGGMSRSCDRIIHNLRKHHTVNIYHFTNKLRAFETIANVNGTYTAIPIYEDSSHTLNTLWAFLTNCLKVKESNVLVGYGSHLCLKGIPLISKWLNKPLLTCFRGNDFDSAIFSQKKQDIFYAINESTAIACVSKEKVDRIKTLKLNEEVFYTPNSIDLEQWRILKSDIELSETYKSKINKSSNIKIIGLVGYLKQKKGVDFFLSCLKKSELYQKSHLHFIGDVEPHITWQLEKLNISYSITKPNSHTSLIANYLMCDAIAIPSIYDGMPNVIFEAGALKIPVIASKVGGILDVLNTSNAFIFNTLSESSLLEALRDFYLANNHILYLKSNNLENTIKKNYTPKIEISNYLKILKKINAHEN